MHDRDESLDEVCGTLSSISRVTMGLHILQSTEYAYTHVHVHGAQGAEAIA